MGVDMAGEQISPYVAGLMGNSPYIKNEDYDNSITGKLHRMNPFAETRWEDKQYKPNPYYPHNVNPLPPSTFKVGVTDATVLAAQKAEQAARTQALAAQKAQERQALQDRYNAAMSANAQKAQVYNPVTQRTESVMPTGKGYSSAYYKGEYDKLSAELARKKAAVEARNAALGQWFPGTRATFSDEVMPLSNQVDQAKRMYEASLANEQAAMVQRAQRQEASRINQGLRDNGIDQIVRPDQIDKDVAMANYKTTQITPSVAGEVSNAVNAVGSIFGVPNTQAIATTPAVKSTPTATTTATSATTNKPAATTTTQSTRTATPMATQTTRSTPTATTGGGVYQGGLPPIQPQPTATTGGGVYQGGLPPKQPMAPQPVPQQVVGYVPPPVRDGYDMVGSAKQAFVPGTPISENVARAMYKLQNETNTARNQMMSSARTGQVMDAMNNPDTYRVAEMFARQGMPMDQAMHLAMTQTTAANGDWLGVGATIPAGQKALSDMNDRNMQFAAMFGTPWDAREVNGSVYMGNPYFRAMNPNGTIVTTDGTKSGLNGDQIMYAMAGANNPLAVNQVLANANLQSQVSFTNMINKNSYGNRGYGGGSNANISNKADQLIKNADKKAEENTTPTPTNTIPGL